MLRREGGRAIFGSIKKWSRWFIVKKRQTLISRWIKIQYFTYCWFQIFTKSVSRKRIFDCQRKFYQATFRYNCFFLRETINHVRWLTFSWRAGWILARIWNTLMCWSLPSWWGRKQHLPTVDLSQCTAGKLVNTPSSQNLTDFFLMISYFTQTLCELKGLQQFKYPLVRATKGYCNDWGQRMVWNLLFFLTLIFLTSAGVGRTGTFIALDYFMQHLDRHGLDGEIDIFSYVMRMRYNRPSMVQAETQYIFIYDALEEVCKHTRNVSRNIICQKNILKL